MSWPNPTSRYRTHASASEPSSSFRWPRSRPSWRSGRSGRWPTSPAVSVRMVRFVRWGIDDAEQPVGSKAVILGETERYRKRTGTEDDLPETSRPSQANVSPPTSPFTVAVLGAGRVGGSFARALRAAGHDVLAELRRDDDPSPIARADVIVIAVPDDALAGDSADLLGGYETLIPLLRATVENIAQLGPDAALTGPIVRGDAGTVSAHLRALPAHLLESYVANARRTLARAVASGRLDEAGAARVAEALEGAMVR